MSQVDKYFGVTWAEEGADSGFSSTPKQKTRASRTPRTSRTPLAIKKINTPKQMLPRKKDTTKGFYKFMENTKHLTSYGRSLSSTTDNQNTNNNNINNVPLEESISLINRLDQTPTKTPRKSIVSNLLSTSIQNDFLNNSDFDEELYQCSQEVEETLISKSQPECGFKYDEYDSFDNVINCIEIDKLVAKEKGRSMIRYNSMPTNQSVKADRKLLGQCIESSSPSSSSSASSPTTDKTN